MSSEIYSSDPAWKNQMHIILPPHNKVAKNVVDYPTVRLEAQKMIDMLDWLRTLQGRKSHSVAVAHAQVSEDPYDFFVLDRSVKHLFNGRRIIVNPRIVEQSNPVDFREACMSFPEKDEVKTKRFDTIKVEFDVPGGDGVTLKHRKDTFHGLAAFIFQHEMDHAKGINIYM